LDSHDRPDYLPRFQAVAHRAVDGITGGYEHGKVVADLASWARLRLPHGVTSEEREDAERAVTAALSALPVGTSRRDLERARDTALVPVMEGILRRATAEAQERQQREDQAARKAVANAWWSLPLGLAEEVRQKALAEIGKAIDALPAGTPRADLEQARDKIIERYNREYERQEKVARLVDAGLREIRPCIVVLEQDWEFDKNTSALEAELREPVRTALEEELKGSESPEEVARRVRRLVRERLDMDIR
jgi:hypothetical protein